MTLFPISFPCYGHLYCKSTLTSPGFTTLPSPSFHNLFNPSLSRHSFDQSLVNSFFFSFSRFILSFRCSRHEKQSQLATPPPGLVVRPHTAVSSSFHPPPAFDQPFAVIRPPNCRLSFSRFLAHNQAPRCPNREFYCLPTKNGGK